MEESEVGSVHGVVNSSVVGVKPSSFDRHC